MDKAPGQERTSDDNVVESIHQNKTQDEADLMDKGKEKVNNDEDPKLLLEGNGEEPQQDSPGAAPPPRPSSLGNKQESHASSGDDKKYYVVVDLKATCWEDSKKNDQTDKEIIEFSSALVDADTGDVMKHEFIFHKYVRPTKEPKLDEYCMEYNGIKQTDVDDDGAVELPRALEMHRDWLQRNGVVGAAAPVVVTWGDWDCRAMFKECTLKGLAIDGYFRQWINLKKPFEKTYRLGSNYDQNSKTPIGHLKVREAFDEAPDLNWEGAPKGGLSHVKNKASLLSVLVKKGANLDINGCIIIDNN